MRFRKPALTYFLGTVFTVVISNVSYGQSAAGNTTQEDVDELRRELAIKNEQIETLIDRLIYLEQRVETIENRSQDDLSQRASDGADNEPLVAAAVTIPQQQSAARTQAPDIEAQPDLLPSIDSNDQDRMVRDALESTLIEKGGLLLPPWAYSIDSSYSYIQSSVDNIIIDGFTIFPVLVVGDIVSEKVSRDLNIFNLTFRLGLPWETQAQIRVPYGHQKFRSFSADGAESKLNDNAMGDIELGISKQLYKSNGKWPDLEATLRYKFDTGENPFTAEEGDIFVGSGFDSVNLLFTAVKVSDPMVYFAGVDYSSNRPSSQSIGSFDPGDSWGFNLGMAIALNLTNSLSFGYDQHFTQKSRLDGVKIPGSYSTTSVFSIGTTYSVTDSTTIDLSVGMGITADSPDLIFSVSVPIRGSF